MSATPKTSIHEGMYRGDLYPPFNREPLRLALSSIGEWIERPVEVLSEGRHRVIRCQPEADGECFDWVIKSFGRQPGWKDALDQQRGTKAQRAFIAAVGLADHGVGTPQPVAHLSRWSGSRIVDSYLVTEYEDGLVDFRSRLIDLYQGVTDCSELMRLLQRVATAVRAMHDAGVMHRDLGNQNILLQEEPEPTVLFTDLNRAAIRDSLSLAERGTDLARLHLPSDLLRIFKEMYWQGDPPSELQRAERRTRRSYRFHTVTRRFRHPLRERRLSPTIPDYPAGRDLWIWDAKSAQAISAYAGRERHALMSATTPIRQLLASAKRGLQYRRAYRDLLQQAFTRSVDMRHRCRIALEPTADHPEQRVALLKQLGADAVHLRFYHHQDEAAWQQTAKRVHQLTADGLSVSAALVQDRRAVRDPKSWIRFCRSVLEDVGSVLAFVEIGHAINRVKWGIWDLEEWSRLVSVVPSLQAAHPDLTFSGPAGIDFEFAAVAAALDATPVTCNWSALSHHLYVDRRGAPEGKQGSFSTLEKCALARAMARVHPACGDRFICSETNWPLQGTGIYSPVGSPYLYPGQVVGAPSVSEEDYAAYMVRYLVIALCSGLASDVVWWRLAAHGFGLVDDRPADSSTWKRRPAYHAMKTWLLLCGRGVFEKRQTHPDGGTWYRFRRDDQTPVWLGYREEGTGRCALPASAAKVLDYAGNPMPHGPADVELGGLPLYLVEPVA